MSASKRGKDKNKLPPFVALTWDLLNSPAYRDLTGSAGKALPYFWGKHGKGLKRDRGDFSGTFEFSYGEAERLGFAPRTFSRVIQELVQKGFIDPAGYGGLRGFCKSFNKFSLSSRWMDYGITGFKAASWKQSE